MRGKPHTTTLPDDLSQYVEGLAQIQGISVSQTLVRIVRANFDSYAKTIIQRKKR